MELKELIKHRNTPFRLLLLFLIIIPFIYFNDFSHHFYVYLTGNIITEVITQQWHIVLISVVIFLAFLIPLSYRRKANWAEYGLVSAFFVSLFVEMYGIPLTILFASKYFFTATNLPETIVAFKVFGVDFAMDMAMSYGLILMFIGGFLISFGWLTLYKNIKQNKFVTNGIYKYSRHPQYLGFILIILGWLIAWPTILTIIFAPILIYKYIRVCVTEEKEILKKSPEYKKYIEEVPFFI
ncbi:MAG: isoprenylcysteine carboxylmethyltransferase family protein [Candidatus Aenigmarchaeota archaeon]|nr:isoprenylcysteine carboxylmethyltransferase family protein [Candidatus Aenigmarchaeota archaeon]